MNQQTQPPVPRFWKKSFLGYNVIDIFTDLPIDPLDTTDL